MNEAQPFDVIDSRSNTNSNDMEPLMDSRDSPADNVQTVSRFASHPIYQDILAKHRMVEALGMLQPYFRVFDEHHTGRCWINGRELVDFSSYNYLGLAEDPRVREAAKAAIDVYGPTVSASRMIAGERAIHRELEAKIAAMLGAEDCVAFVGGYVTNESTLGHLYGKGDLIITDELAHASIMQGAQLSRAKRLKFAHNDLNALETLLIDHRKKFRRVLIIIEGVYSMDGDIPHLPDYIFLKQKYDADLMVDEAHSMGVLGQRGGGIRDLYNVDAADVDIWMGTLSKAFSSCGGYIAGSKELVSILRFTGPGFVYSVGMPPSNAAAAIAAIDILKREPERAQHVRDLAEYFRSQSAEKGFDTGLACGAAVCSIIVGDTIRCVRMSDALFKKGFSVFPMVEPAVPHNQCRLRFFFSASHSRKDIDNVITALQEIFSLQTQDEAHA
jgi:8-amino-7-oxononanoate synthase